MMARVLKRVTTRSRSVNLAAYRLKYIHAVSTNKTIAIIQSDESLISVFLAMSRILSPILRLQCRRIRGGILAVNMRLSSLNRLCRVIAQVSQADTQMTA
jgi:hypothetical protein